jgi:hypothetical protein
VLTTREVESFVADGFVAIRGAVPGDVVTACQDVIWAELGKLGVTEDPASWAEPVVRISCPEGGPFVDAGTQPVVWEACDQLIGGADRWWRRPGVGGTLPVRFPSERDPGDAGWHIEASYAQAAATATEHLPAALATGLAGDVFLCHPFLVHAASWPHRGTRPRIIAQPAVALHDQFPLTTPLSPVEQAIAR